MKHFSFSSYLYLFDKIFCVVESKKNGPGPRPKLKNMSYLLLYHDWVKSVTGTG